MMYDSRTAELLWAWERYILEKEESKGGKLLYTLASFNQLAFKAISKIAGSQAS
jgi:hypothetical protein